MGIVWKVGEALTQFRRPKGEWADPHTLEKNKSRLDRFREIVVDPLNLLIDRVPEAGYVKDGLVYLHNGFRVKLSGENSYYDDFSEILVINRGVHEPLEEFAFQEMLKQSSGSGSMLEVGAYWGHYSMWFKGKNPRGQVVLAEPYESHLNVGKSNFSLNDLEGHFVQSFVGKPGPNTMSIAQILDSHKVEELEVLHVDIQGAEVQLLQDSERELKSGRVRRVFISTHSESIHSQIKTIITECGLIVEVESDYEHTTSEDGLIVARSPKAAKIESLGFEFMGRKNILKASSETLANYVAGISARSRMK